MGHADYNGARSGDDMSLLQFGGGKGEQTAEGPPLDSPGGEISFSARALVEVRKILEREGGQLFRVGVSKGGCSGWNYEISFQTSAPTSRRVTPSASSNRSRLRPTSSLP